MGCHFLQYTVHPVLIRGTLTAQRQAVSSKEDQANITSEAGETSPGQPVPDLQEDQCKHRRDQSGSEEDNSVEQALTTSIIIDSPDNKVARILRRVQEAESQHLARCPYSRYNRKKMKEL
ncbi:hypothetical protein TNCV_3437171 [Trichonephila clavipes]|nr:hypothetical protein TNCV_3437171 [Trichonephila clavipes]